MGLKEKLTEKLEELGNAIQDLTTLDVTTLSGDVNQVINSQTGKFDLKYAMDELTKTDSKLRGKVYIVATTHIDVDQDSVNFVKNNLSDDEKSLVKAHLEAIKAAQEARHSFLKFAKEFITGIANPI